MPKWWTSKTPTPRPTMTSNDDQQRKTNRSLVSFSLDKQIVDTGLDRRTMKTNSLSQIHPLILSGDTKLSQQKTTPSFISYPGVSMLPKSWRPTQANILPSTDAIIKPDTQVPLDSDINGYECLRIFDELIQENRSCFGFSLSLIPSKSCLYAIVLLFLGTCVLISLAAHLKK